MAGKTLSSVTPTDEASDALPEASDALPEASDDRLLILEHLLEHCLHLRPLVFGNGQPLLEERGRLSEDIQLGDQPVERSRHFAAQTLRLPE